jgi:hypothetical protein
MRKGLSDISSRGARFAWIIWVSGAAFFVAAVLTGVLPILFPMGLAYWIDGDDVPSFFLACGIYLVVVAATVRANTPALFWVLFGVLCLLLTANVAGCYQMANRGL